jgi:signal peptidase
MEPTYEAGDIAIVQEVDNPIDLEVGDVIRYRRGGIAIVHRIVDIQSSDDGPVFITQGDNVRSPDRPVPARDVDGKVVWVIPEVGNLKLWLAGS